MFLDKFAPYKFSKTQQMETNDGLAWSAVLMLGKTKVLHVQDGGYGGGLEITALDPAAYKAFEEHTPACRWSSSTTASPCPSPAKRPRRRTRSTTGSRPS